MLLKNLTFVALGITLFSCKDAVVEAKTQSADIDKENIELAVNKGYELMSQKCFICHFEKMDPSKKDKMIAPPMMRIQEHYKPNYPTKEAFVKAVTAWVSHPDIEKTVSFVSEDKGMVRVLEEIQV